MVVTLVVKDREEEDKEEEECNAGVKKFREEVSTRRAGGGGGGKKWPRPRRILTDGKFLGGKNATTSVGQPKHMELLSQKNAVIGSVICETLTRGPAEPRWINEAT